MRKSSDSKPGEKTESKSNIKGPSQSHFKGHVRLSDDTKPGEKKHSHEYYHHLSHSRENIPHAKPSTSKKASHHHIKRSHSHNHSGSKKSYEVPADGLIPAARVSRVANDMIDQVLGKYTQNQNQRNSTGQDASNSSKEKSHQSKAKQADKTNVNDHSYQDLVKLGQCLECSWDKNYHPCLLSKPGDNAKCKEEMRKKGFNLEDPKFVCSPHEPPELPRHKSSHSRSHYYESGHFYALDPDSHVDDVYHHVFEQRDGSLSNSRSTSRVNLHSHPHGHSKRRSSSVDEGQPKASRSRSKSNEARNSKDSDDSNNRESLKAVSRTNVDKHISKKDLHKSQPPKSPSIKTNMEIHNAKSGPQRTKSTIKATTSKSIHGHGAHSHVHYNEESAKTEHGHGKGKHEAHKVHSQSSSKHNIDEVAQDRSATHLPTSTPSKGDISHHAHDHRKSRFEVDKEPDPSHTHLNPNTMPSEDVRCNDPNCDPSKFANAGGQYSKDGKTHKPTRSEASPEVKELYALTKGTACQWGKNYHPCSNRKNEEDAARCKAWRKENGIDCKSMESGLTLASTVDSEYVSKTDVETDTEDVEAKKS